MSDTAEQVPEQAPMPGHPEAAQRASTLFTTAGAGPDKQRAIQRSIAAHHALAALPGVRFATGERVVIVVHPGFELLDVAGPLHFLAATGATVQLATTGAAGAPVGSGGGAALVPDLRLEDVDPAPMVLLVPGGDTGVLLRDEAAMAAIARLGHGARWVAGVCSGSIALAAAGLLEGRRATSHWGVRHLLGGYGAIEVEERVVEDGNRVTAAGVTAGMDLAIGLAARISGDGLARFAVLGAEYAPEPPFATGTPETAGPALVALSRDFLAPLEEELRAEPGRTREAPRGGARPAGVVGVPGSVPEFET